MALNNTQYHDFINKSADKHKMAETLTTNASIKLLSVPTEKVLGDDYLLDLKRYFQIICPDKVVKRISKFAHSYKRLKLNGDLLSTETIRGNSSHQFVLGQFHTATSADI